MPWKVSPVHEVRFALVHAVRHLHVTVAAAARQFGVSRRVAYKWLGRHDAEPDAPLTDRSRRPRVSPARTDADVEQHVLRVRDRFNWGPRKIHFYLVRQQPADLSPDRVPAIRTVADILRRHGRVGVKEPAERTAADTRFQRDTPNALWQVDFKGPVEVDRRRLMPLAVIDDHSRYCLAYQPCVDVTMASAWDVLWRVFGEVGLPEQVLADNAFNTMGTARPAGISAFDAKLVRLGITPSHGRSYHPQTQGKVERLNGSSVRELIDFNARRDCRAHFEVDCQRWRGVYNTLRPHEALGDVPPVQRWTPSPRPRPGALPEVAYDAGAVLRVVGDSGVIHFKGHQVLCGRGTAGQRVEVREDEHELIVLYASRTIRQLSTRELRKGTVL
jgi:transposase InsO family protein